MQIERLSITYFVKDDQILGCLYQGISNLSCTFCMSPSSNKPDSTHQLVSRDCKNYIGLRLEGIRMVLLGMSTSIQCNFLLHCTTIVNIFFIPVRGRFRVGVGVDINKTQSNRYTINFIVHFQST